MCVDVCVYSTYYPYPFIYEKICFRELGYNCGAGKSETCRAGRQVETQESVDVAAWIQRQSGGRISSFLGDLGLLGFSMDWVRSTHIMGDGEWGKSTFLKA